MAASRQTTAGGRRPRPGGKRPQGGKTEARRQTAARGRPRPGGKRPQGEDRGLSTNGRSGGRWRPLGKPSHRGRHQANPRRFFWWSFDLWGEKMEDRSQTIARSRPGGKRPHEVETISANHRITRGTRQTRADFFGGLATFCRGERWRSLDKPPQDRGLSANGRR